jgi:hypothetical protein
VSREEKRSTTIEADPIGIKNVSEVDNDDEIAAIQIEPSSLRVAQQAKFERRM